MKKIAIWLFVLGCIVFIENGCKSYINDVDSLKNYAPNEKLNTEDNIDFLKIGVLSAYAQATSEVCCVMDLLSDQLIFTSMMPKATYPTYNQIEDGEILLDNTDVDEAFTYVCQLRRVADDLLDRTNRIAYSDTAKIIDARYTGYFYGAFARYYLANAFGITQTTPGGVINAGPFIPRDSLLNDAVARFLTARSLQSDAVTTRLINSLIAKCYLSKSDYVHAAVYAQQGMQQSDDPMVCLYNSTLSNYYYIFAGNGRAQMGTASRFNAYLQEDSLEINRISLARVLGRDNQYYYFQTKYAEDKSSFPVMTWQENHLMLAELSLRGLCPGDPTTLVNAVRTSHGVDAFHGSVDSLYKVLVERDKELFCTGTRLIDQNRGEVPWHLGVGTWHCLPIPRRERDSNPNL